MRLHHIWCEPKENFFKRIDECGGWELNKPYVAFCHSDERECVFLDYEIRTGWWTTICHSDEYYTWKLTENAKNKLRAEGAERVKNFATNEYFKLIGAR
jgi:hypothetical protein